MIPSSWTNPYPPRDTRYYVPAFATREPIRYSAEQVAEMLNYADACDPTFNRRFDDAAVMHGFNDALLMFFQLQRDEQGGYLCFY